MTNPNEPTLTCSEVVERLQELAYHDNHYFDSGEALKILHSWRERRVQELEEALRLAGIHLGNFANKQYWSDEIGCLQWIGKRHAIEFAKEAQAEAETALANSGWREQIRKGAKHE